MLDQIDDETMISLFLDPFAMSMLRFMLPPPVNPADEAEPEPDLTPVQLAAKDILSGIASIEQDILTRMQRVEKALLAKDKAKSGSLSKCNIVADDICIIDLDEPLSADAENEQTELKGLSLKQRFAISVKNEVKRPKYEPEDELVNVKAELTRFMSVRDASRASDVEFWKENRQQFRSLFHVYIQNRGARPSTARLESVFSLASSAVPSQRASLSTDTLNNLLVLKTAPVTMDIILEAVKKMESSETSSKKQ